MKRITIKNVTTTLIAILIIFSLVQYLYRRDVSILLLDIILFCTTISISLFIYFLLYFDNRCKLTYTNINELSDDMREKIIKEDIRDIKESQKINDLKEVFCYFIIKQIHILGFFELLLIIHYLFTDTDNINKILISTFPAFFALIISVADIIKKLKR